MSSNLLRSWDIGVRNCRNNDVLNMENETKQKKKIFSRYEVFVIAVLEFIQFTIILDFMVLSPLGAQLMLELKITTSQFGWVVSGYAFSAGTAGLLTAGFADRF